jgi:hypothetical protein
MKLLWLGDRRGALTDWTTQQWVRLTGRRIALGQTPWLDGPVGPPTGIGARFFDGWAAATGLEVLREGGPRGLIHDLRALTGPTFDPTVLHPDVRRFYEETSTYEMDAWSEWCGAFRPFGGLLAMMFSRRLQQLNVPLDPLDTSHGTTSEVAHLTNPATGDVVMAAWVRRLERTGNVLYAGAYSVASIPGHPSPCVKVVFPLPNGNAVVLLRPSAHADGSLTVASVGDGFGDPGFYFTVHRSSRIWARYVRTMRETIRVYATGNGEVRADHVMWLWGLVFLKLHYRLRHRSRPAAA